MGSAANRLMHDFFAEVEDLEGRMRAWDANGDPSAPFWTEAEDRRISEIMEIAAHEDPLPPAYARASKIIMDLAALRHPRRPRPDNGVAYGWE